MSEMLVTTAPLTRIKLDDLGHFVCCELEAPGPTLAYCQAPVFFDADDGDGADVVECVVCTDISRATPTYCPVREGHYCRWGER